LKELSVLELNRYIEERGFEQFIYSSDDQISSQKIIGSFCINFSKLKAYNSPDTIHLSDKNNSFTVSGVAKIRLLKDDKSFGSVIEIRRYSGAKIRIVAR